ncbi:tyrosine-type recombinase/integrase [Tranquillimonas rosea]|uniref:tyrosine-type recombinase/integrase n=1 Tax=Tranquillimonas rosea TaxID=641238 RepID=UPI003BAB2054
MLVYYRPKGDKPVRLPPEDDPGFLTAYMKAAGLSEKPLPNARTGTLAAAIVAYRRSDIYLALAQSTRATWGRALDDMRRRYGQVPLDKITTKNIRADLAKLDGNPANNRRKVWRGLFRWCLDAGMIETNPAEAVKARKVPKTDGHIPWTPDDVQAFRDRWPYQTPQRLAFELIFWTGARISDARLLGPGMVDADGWLSYTQKKTGGRVAVPWTAPAPAYAAADGHLAAALAAVRHRHMAWMVTAHGQTRSEKAASQWFSAAARAAGIKGKGAHGLRKSRAIIMRENGASTDQRAAWLGHESLSEVEQYGKDADRRRIISGTESSNAPRSSPNGTA